MAKKVAAATEDPEEPDGFWRRMVEMEARASEMHARTQRRLEKLDALVARLKVGQQRNRESLHALEKRIDERHPGWRNSGRWLC